MEQGKLPSKGIRFELHVKWREEGNKIIIFFQIFAVDILHTRIFSSLEIFGGETKAAHAFQHTFILCKERARSAE
jgi:hypothetical protein